MIPKHFKLVGEFPTHFELHDERDGRRFPIAKGDLNPGMKAKLSKIPKFEGGGEVAPEFVPGQDYSNAPLPGDINSELIYPAAPSGGQQLEQINNALALTHPTVPAPETPPPPPNVQGPAPASIAASPQPQPQPQAPVAAPPQMDPLSIQSLGENKVLQDELTAIKGGAAAEGAEGRANAQALHQANEKIDAMMTPTQILQKHQAQDDELQKAYESKEIDPNHYWHEKSTGSKIAAGIGLILGGMSAGTLGGENPAMKNINAAIDRDVEAQKNSQSKAMNLWEMNRKQTNSEIDATAMTQNQLLAGVKSKMMEAAANSQSALARARIAPVIAQINNQMLANNYRRALMTPNGHNGSGFMEVDPAQLVPGLVPEPRQKEVFEEIGRAQNIAQNGQKMLQAFDDAAKDTSVIGTVGGLRTPRSTMALHQLMLPNFKAIDGTVRQAAMDESFKNITPTLTDTANDIIKKRQALENWIHSEAAAPTAKGHGLDLQRFRSTSIDPRARLNPAEINIYNQAQQLIQSGDPAAKQKGELALKKLGVQ